MWNVFAYIGIGSVTVNIFCHLTGDRRSQRHIDRAISGGNGGPTSSTNCIVPPGVDRMPCHFVPLCVCVCVH